MTHTVLHIDASPRADASVTRALSQRIVDRLAPRALIRRDLVQPLPLLDQSWIAANFTSPDNRTEDQASILRLSDTLVDELRQSDVVVIGFPIWNFGIPAGLKAWVDLIARAGTTFRYSETGPQGLLEGKRAILAVSSGGTSVGSDIDFATGYMRHVLGFVGIHDMDIVAADKMALDPDAALKSAHAAVDRLAA